MADPISSSIVTGILKLIAAQAGKAATEFVKAKIKEYLNGTTVDRAIKATSANFPHVGSIESSLKNFVLSERFAAMLEDQMDGKRAIADEEMADSFVSEFGFFTSMLRSHEDALQVLRRFLENLRDELYRSLDAAVYAARTEELHHREVISALGQLERQAHAQPDQREIKGACARITDRLASVITERTIIIRRASLRSRIDEFLNSSARYCLVLGEADVGKSVFMAIEGGALSEAGWTTLLTRGRDFSLEGVAKAIGEELVRALPSLAWQQVVNLWADDLSSLESPFVLMIKAIDEADPDTISHVLSNLHDSLGKVSTARFKVIISCKKIVWKTVYSIRELPLRGDYRTGGRGSEDEAVVIEVTDFSTAELDEALRKIGADELLAPANAETKPDTHIIALRSLLKHPSSFGNYAALRQGGNAQSLSGQLTWSHLIEKRLFQSLAKASCLSRTSADDLLRTLKRLAAFSAERSARDFMLEEGVIRAIAPDLFSTSSDAPKTPLLALSETGVLLISERVDSGALIGVRHNDVGAYLLSFELERRATERPSSEVGAFINEVIKNSWHYPPIADALLVWVDRLLSERPRRQHQLRHIIKALIDNHQIRQSGLIRLLNPAALELIFEVIKREGVIEYFFPYRDSALQVPPSPESLDIVRHHLSDPNVQVRQLAVELAGIYRDADSSAEIISLLTDSDSGVKGVGYSAIGRIGQMALPQVLEVVQDGSRPGEFRLNGLYALRNIGFRDDQVSEAMRLCLGKTNDAEFLAGALLTVAHLRDCGHQAEAISALQRPNTKVVCGAAKYLTECPDLLAFGLLHETLLANGNSAGKDYYSYLIPTQLIAALIKTDREKAIPLVAPVILDGVMGKGSLTRFNALQMIKKHGIHEMVPFILEKAVTALRENSKISGVRDYTDNLQTLWRPEELYALTARAADLLAQGTNIVGLFVDAIAPNMPHSEDFPMGDRLNLIKDLIPVVKAQSENFVPESVRLLPQVDLISLGQLSELLWVAGDNRAEAALLQRLENPTSISSEDAEKRGHLVRALGTCGAKRGASAVLEYIRTGESISCDLYKEAICPLIIRGLIEVDELAAVARDHTVPIGGRITSLLALAETGYLQKQKDLVIDLAADPSAENVQAQAARLVGFLEDASIIPKLVSLLRTGSHLSVKSEAAVSDIESALEEQHNDGCLNALAYFQKNSSLPLVLERVRTSRYEIRLQYLKALGHFWNYDKGKAAIVEEFERWTEFRNGFYDDQSPLISGLVFSVPNVLLEYFIRLYDGGHIKSRARDTMAHHLSRLFDDERVDRSLLLGVVKRLVCDRDVKIRDRVAQSLCYSGGDLCRVIFEELSDGSCNEWERACGFYILSFREGDLNHLELAKYEKEWLVRRVADEALMIREKRMALKRHAENFAGADGLKRLAAFQCIKEQALLSTIWQLEDIIEKRSLAWAFLPPLFSEVNRRLESEYREKQKAEEKISESRGTIYFD